ncbi:peptidoglycan-binding protein [Adlercreutzia faecimuris]|uniref:CHAP domain-containing protein n=1 Tax=Adlercreutzia faecimuris TaxID=2897341 RepID=A0ABS9WF90_9ACTN|nr:peptidoglycan-binding protein [Adlercreutzia sp. JBNU-10]MCI2241534.1 CHAP domain-containing protein [Adlercreutzia sp. JBNU-10]
MATADELVALAQGEVGYSRWDDPLPGTKYGRWFEEQVDKDPSNFDYGASGVAYCAMFVSWCLWMLGVECAGMPSAYCPAIHNHQHLSAGELEPGDLALFDWEDDGTDDHVGIVVSNDREARVIRTIEGNTAGGRVAERTRAYSTVCGGIRPRFDAAPAAKPSAPTAPTEGKEETVYAFPLVKRGAEGDAVRLMQAALNVRAAAKLSVDGDYGDKTGKALVAWQRRCGVEADGDCGPITWGTLLCD